MKRVLSSIAVLAFALALAGCAGGDVAATAAPTTTGSTVPAGITARGLGTVTGTPDTMTVVLGVQTRGQSAKGALDADDRAGHRLRGDQPGHGHAAGHRRRRRTHRRRRCGRR